jgi:hypothetical protein
MDAPRWTEVVATFDELVELDPGQQEEMLAAIGAADLELRRNVEELLAADAQAEDRLAQIDQALTPSRSARPEGVHDTDPLKLVGRAVSHFRVIEPLAYGGMGVVYEAVQLSLGRRVALKVLPFAATLDARQLQRFHNEARVGDAIYRLTQDSAMVTQLVDVLLLTPLSALGTFLFAFAITTAR